MIIDKPLIEGNIHHLKSIMEAFYIYSDFLFNNKNPFYQSSLIDIKYDNFYTHNILLKSSKPDVEPLKIKIGNSILSDIINCFDQLSSSTKVKNFNLEVSNNISNKGFLNFVSKEKTFGLLLPPLISIFSIFILSTSFIYFYEDLDDKEKKISIYSNNLIRSIKSIKTIV